MRALLLLLWLPPLLTLVFDMISFVGKAQLYDFYYLHGECLCDNLTNHKHYDWILLHLENFHKILNKMLC